MTGEKNLKELNSFGLPVVAKYYREITSEKDLNDLYNNNVFEGQETLVLGGGSNILFTHDIEALVLHINILGIEVIHEDKDNVIVKAGAGENWHNFVLYCISQGWGGIENLSLIPGKVGAAPIQNIGAYGVEVKDVFESLNYFNIKTGETSKFLAGDCNFGYRDSVFKREFKGKGVVTSVVFKLNKNPIVNTSYGAISGTLTEWNIHSASIKDVSDAVIHIRRSKLPDPNEIGNAGSFFKNPVINSSSFNLLKTEFPNLPGYQDGENVKVPAGWLIEKAGWKGLREGDIGVHKDQALVLVNYGNGKGEDLKNLAERIKKSVFEKFSIDLEQEVNIL